MLLDKKTYLITLIKDLFTFIIGKVETILHFQPSAILFHKNEDFKNTRN